jgi:hypothetical protein
MAELLRADGTRETVTPKNGKTFEFKGEAYVMLDTDIIQIVPTNDGRIMLIDEEGKLRDHMQVNVAATALYRYGHADPIVGNALVCNTNEVQ